MHGRTRLIGLTVAVTLAGGLAASAPAASAAPAGGAPGALSHFDLARKDCLGTARNTKSKIWYTLLCATASGDPHCTFDTAAVPKAMDVLTPSGVAQSDELDYTVHAPVVIAGVSIP
jgi:hypothetical protein